MVSSAFTRGFHFRPATPNNAPPASIEAVQVIGLTGVKQNTKGNLKVENGSLTFASSKNTCEVPAASIQDVVTAADSQRVIGGTVGDNLEAGALRRWNGIEPPPQQG